MPRRQTFPAFQHSPVGTSSDCDPRRLGCLRCDTPDTAEDCLGLISADTRDVVVREIGALLWISTEGGINGRRTVRQKRVIGRVRLHALHVRVFVGPCGVLRAEGSIIVVVPHAWSVILRVGGTRRRRAIKTAEVIDTRAFLHVAAHRGAVVAAHRAHETSAALVR